MTWNNTVNAFEQFEKERKDSTTYRFYGVISPLINNALFNDNVSISETTLEGGGTAVVGKKVVASRIFKENGWYGYYDDTENQIDYEQLGDNESSLCQFKTFDPGFDRLGLLDSDGEPNYKLMITYPSDSKDIMLVQNNSGKTLKDGLPIIEMKKISINNRGYSSFKTPINHGLEVDDEIKLINFIDNTGGNLDLTTRTIRIVKLGDQLNQFPNRIFVVDISPQDISINAPGVSTVKRVVNGYESDYYVRVMSALTQTYEDYDIYPAAYGVNPFEDKKAAYYFKKDVDIKNIRDNLGRPLSEVFLTIVKNDTDANVTDINNVYWMDQQSTLPANVRDRFWMPIKGGYMTERNESVNYNVRAIGANYPGGSPNFPQTHFDLNADTVVGGNIDESNTLFDGDIVEYNSYELNERVLEDIYHRINTVYREYGGYLPGNLTYEGFPDISKDKREGYIYRPHLPIEIRAFSDYIEEGDTVNMLGIPDYATLVYSASTQPLPTGDISTLPLTPNSVKYRWRDYWDVGFVDANGNGVDYPFESGAHYLYLLSNFYMMRQDPPCGVAFTSEEITLPTDKELFNYYLGLTSYYDYSVTNALTLSDTGSFIDLENVNPMEPIDIDIRFIQFFGQYNLGLRDTPGGCVDFSEIETKTITDEC